MTGAQGASISVNFGTTGLRRAQARAAMQTLMLGDGQRERRDVTRASSSNLLRLPRALSGHCETCLEITRDSSHLGGPHKSTVWRLSGLYTTLWRGT